MIFSQAGILFPAPAHPNDTLIWGGLALITGTGVAQIIGLRSGTGSRGSQPAAPDSPEPSPRSSISGGDREPLA